jgi:acyl-CoA synthetase (AMP-forming)/AMP-acid ligase II
MKIIDSETGRELPWDGQTSGELLVQGPWVCAGYFQSPTIRTHTLARTECGDGCVQTYTHRVICCATHSNYILRDLLLCKNLMLVLCPQTVPLHPLHLIRPPR